MLIYKSTISGLLRRAWVILIPFVFGITMMLLLMLGKIPKINGCNTLQFPEILVFMVAGIIECCMDLGLIPVNDDYTGLFRISTVAGQITDRSGRAIYRSDSAAVLTPQQAVLPSGSRIDDHTILYRMEIPGGYGFWQKDMTEMDLLNEELSEVNFRLYQETELLRRKNELREKEAVIEHRIALYDAIVNRVQAQSQQISLIANRALASTDLKEKNRCRREINLLNSYIKRFANLMLISEATGTISSGELALSISEVMRYLNIYGIPGECIYTAEGSISAEGALAVFEQFQQLLQCGLPVLQGAIACLTMEKGQIACKLTLENCLLEVSRDATEALSLLGIHTLQEQEDDTLYVTFLFSERREIG
ncbi:MAG: hypothetical protein Q4B85_08435 [Lachnospiraceae bacterium]|nr:hypothetical protein [Lachnospiraceae bacterium]